MGPTHCRADKRIVHLTDVRLSDKYFRYYTLTNSVKLPLIYFRFNYITVFACVFVIIIVSVNGMDLFPLTDISVTVIVNGKNTGIKALNQLSNSLLLCS